ncbi:MAG: VOC family protein [Flavobacteriales bacterium]|nr:VOC family protein [Flavobacteriales bacterium]
MTNAVSWFEIPVKDFNRAQQFYSTLYGKDVVEMPMPDGTKYGVLPYDHENGGVGGGIIETKEQIETATNGLTVYLNGGDDLSTPLSKVEAAGGKIVMPKTSIGENGFMALFIDTEGNRLALHSAK